MTAAELVATRGLPASGKTTFARRWVDAAPDQRCRINRDDTRRMTNGGYLGTAWQEKRTTIVCHGAIRDLLRVGTSVIVDDTNLDDSHLHQLWDIAHDLGVPFTVADFTGVRLETCIGRDDLRPVGERVGVDVIVGMYDRYLLRRSRPLPLPRELSESGVRVVDMCRAGVHLGGVPATLVEVAHIWPRGVVLGAVGGAR